MDRRLTWRWALAQSVAAGLLLWAAFPPLALSPLAWLAPSFWVRIALPKELPRGSYWAVWGSSVCLWFALLEGIGRAFWANYIGLVILGSYLAMYQVLFVLLTRLAAHRWGISVVFAAPVVWTGLELTRGLGAAGFSAALLGHTQVAWVELIQLADIFGAYGVSFLIMLVSAALARMWPGWHHPGWCYWPAVPAATALAAALLYGHTRQLPPPDASRRIAVALLQGTEDTRFDRDFAVTQRRALETFQQYWRLALDAKHQRPDLAAIIWPESVFTAGLSELVIEGEIVPPAELGFGSRAEFQAVVEKRIEQFQAKIRVAAETFNQRPTDSDAPRHTHLIVGTDSVHLRDAQQQTYNSALLISPEGEVAAKYYKMHRVLLGEYVPMGEHWPWLYDWLPIGRGLTPGERPSYFDVAGVGFVPSICFEITVPHLIRRQVVELAAEGRSPDVLVNLTNDGWFWGSSILDLHLACGVFRAVELRRPLVIAANTGLSAWIDSRGKVRATLPRRQEGFIIADLEVPTTAPVSIYQRLGDAGAWLCLAGCGVLLLEGIWQHLRAKVVNRRDAHSASSSSGK